MFSQKVIDSLSRSSWIRAMFEEGENLRKIYGPDKVYDFSIGNPEMEPPLAVRESIKEIALSEKPGQHRYMSNAGYQEVREIIAEYINKENGVSLSAQHIVMTCGAAGGLNVALKALLNPGEEVIVLAPYFVEYLYYIDNHGGVPVIVPTDPETFQPDIEAIEKNITNRTKAIIINSPNNPTGVIYSETVLKSIAQLLEAKEKEFGTHIYVISDEPYARIIYDGAKVPSILKIFKNSIVINSFSKSHALPGERIGYIAVSSSMENCGTLVNALVFCNRTLGFVNAPALFQKVIAETLDAAVDIEAYKKRRDILYNHLTNLGFSCIKPEGGFYLFPKAFIDDDVEFKNYALKHNILIVPGQGFGWKGHFRLSYCIDIKVIENSLPAWEALAKQFK